MNIWKLLLLGYGLLAKTELVAHKVKVSEPLLSSEIDKSTQRIHKIEKRERLRLQRMNQPVCIQNLFVRYPRNVSFGEHRSSKLPEQNRIERILKHVQELAEIAAKKHALENHDNNTVTRILLNEFALYTYETPLSQTETKQLMEGMEKIGTEHHENIHLALGTIPISTPEGRLLNTGIYLQCGSTPVLSSITKSFPVQGDEQYSDYQLSGKSSATSLDRKKEPISMTVSDDSAVNYHPLITCKTMDHAQFTVGMDICYDHAQGHVKQSYSHEIKKRDENKSSGYLPRQRDHLIISNTVTAQEEQMISSMFSQADPVMSGTRFSINYHKLLETEIPVENKPAFGESFSIFAATKQSLALKKDDPMSDPYFEGSRLKKIDAVNKKNLEKSITAHLDNKKIL